MTPAAKPTLPPSGIAARLHCVEPRQRVLAALGPHSREAELDKMAKRGREIR
jgi:hypothetical protein